MLYISYKLLSSVVIYHINFKFLLEKLQCVFKHTLNMKIRHEI